MNRHVNTYEPKILLNRKRKNKGGKDYLEINI